METYQSCRVNHVCPFLVIVVMSIRDNTTVLGDEAKTELLSSILETWSDSIGSLVTEFIGYYYKSKKASLVIPHDSSTPQ